MQKRKAINLGGLIWADYQRKRREEKKAGKSMRAFFSILPSPLDHDRICFSSSVNRAHSSNAWKGVGVPY